ncbi:hypothetical protein [Bacillus sp. ISL-47]|uniref:hypothetical protein n=1 Tax=Bacillus sp. ISL-47 TaxID=2819130 RepID=UPI001BE94E90|nr:hypothetical protein [Bacillus sp. ISL-47]MBT2706965.1 hypothetical protein [Pseudomonas sp. ISL-84]
MKLSKCVNAKNSRLLLIIMMIIPWISLPLLGRKTIKRFLPATVFICLVVKVMNIIAEKRKWWWFYTSIHSKIKGDIPFILGPYFICSLWVLKMTYGKFSLFLITNAILHFLFVFPGGKLLKKLGIVSLVRINSIQLFFILLIRAVLLYSFQFVKENLNFGRTEGEVERS